MTWTTPRRFGLVVLLTVALTGAASAQDRALVHVEQLPDGGPGASYMTHLALLDWLDSGATDNASRPFATDFFPPLPSTAAEVASLSAKAEGGDREAMAELAEVYDSGLGVARDDDAAVTWMAKAADRGRPAAMRLLGDFAFDRTVDYVPVTGAYNFKIGLSGGLYIARTPEREQRALAWYHKAVDAGDREAMDRLADMSLKGAGVPQSVSDAMGWLEKAAALGSDHAMLWLAEMYERGLNVPPENVKAAQAAPLARDLAQVLMALGRPNSLPGDPQKALYWYDRAVKQAPQNAYYRNAACWLRAERGVEPDKALADCTEATRLKPEEAEYWDSLALVQMRLGKTTEAEASYDAAVQRYDAKQRVGDRETARSLYGRGVARIRLGQEAAGRADIAYAQGIDPKVADVFRDFGISI